MKKSKSLKILERLALEEKKRNNPNLPDHCLAIPKFNEKKSTQLEKAIQKFIELMGYQCENIKVTGRRIDKREHYTDALGHRRQIGSVEWVKSSMRKGSADRAATIEGHSVKIEVKIGKDSQSDDQKQYQAEIEQAGGTYLIVKSFDQFFEWYMSQEWIKNKPKM